MNIAKVAVEQTLFSFDKAFDYSIPLNLIEKAKPGCRVLVPFGKGNKKRQGIIMELATANDLEVTKPILSVLDETPLLTEEMLSLAVWMKEKYFCTLFDAIKPMLPTGLNIRIVTAYKARENIDRDVLEKLDPIGRQIVTSLINSKATVEQSRMMEIMELDDDSIFEQLVNAGLIERTDKSIRRVGDATVKMARLTFDYDNIDALDEATQTLISSMTNKQKRVAEFLNMAGAASIKEICYFVGVTQAVITALEKKGLIEYFENEVLRSPDKPKIEYINSEIILTEEQQQAYDNMLEQYHNGGGVSLLYGVTGSGKTQVFMKLVKAISDLGKQVIVMVPEIALTPQTLNHFISRFGDNVAILHSGLSLGERMDEWKKVKQGKAKIVVGTRSAVFAPCDNLGLIIIDEEQEHTYKSEGTPRFHARDIARYRTAINKGLLVLASATPSVESFYNAQNGRYSLNRLTKRYGSANLPQIDVVDMREQTANTGILSQHLIDAIGDCLDNGHQAILLHNRRGYNTYVSCRSCGYVFTCPNCSISMTYHSVNNMLMCHYCSSAYKAPHKCPQCGSDKVRFSGFGTQRIEDELSQYFPEARIMRLDADSTMTKNAYQIKLGEFAKGGYDIMVGTQMVAKGLDFANVTLVGVILADQIMYGNDFRSFEKAFAMLTQVVGRSGRGQYPGTAVVQTFTPENPLIELAARQDYDEFYKNEITTRKIMLYPPYCDICLVGFVGINRELVEKAASYFVNIFAQKAGREYSDLPLRVLGPAVAGVPKVCGSYRYRIIIKCRDNKRFRELMGYLLCKFQSNREFKTVTAYADMNPETII